MNMRNVDLLALVVSEGSLTAAARAAGVSQPAVSQAMAALAREVDSPLFQRRGRQLLPTDRALALARAARSLATAHRQFSLASGVVTDDLHPTVLRAGLAPAAGLMYGPSLVQAVREDSADTLLSISSGPASHLLEQLVRGEFDFVIAPRPRGLRSPGLLHRVMYISHPVIYARSGHPLADVRMLSDIAQAHWAVAGSAGTPSNVVEEAFRVRRWAPPHVAVQCADYPMLVHIVANTDLLGVVSHPTLVPDPQQHGIVPIRVAEGLPHYEVCLFWYASDARRWPTGMASALARLEAEARANA
ncbi:MAG: LysR family transcriptional regulator [Burkholderiales bacterium]|nr:LysR family transcriptional regulator [Burkholderiales bacterium]MDE1925819.1 LysR family transcriptional regulator [Burkholderiales bacterium]